jgi:polynucleotide 5'-kinase involved in rRNA processing
MEYSNTDKVPIYCMMRADETEDEMDECAERGKTKGVLLIIGPHNKWVAAICVVYLCPIHTT